MSILSQLINDKRYCLSNDEPLLKNCNDLNHNSLQNISTSGVPIPILYGLVFSGSIIISSSVDTAQIVKEIS